jgi:hypothetical protein
MVLKRYIELDEDYKALYGDRIQPDKTAKWNQHAFTVKRKSISVDGTVEAAGVLTTDIGGTVDLQLYDDPCDLNNSVLSPAKREAVIEAAKNVYLTRLEPQAVALYIATAWHEQDLTHELVGNPEWVWLIQRISEDYNCIEQIVIEN